MKSLYYGRRDANKYDNGYKMILPIKIRSVETTTIDTMVA